MDQLCGCETEIRVRNTLFIFFESPGPIGDGRARLEQIPQQGVYISYIPNVCSFTRQTTETCILQIYCMYIVCELWRDITYSSTRT